MRSLSPRAARRATGAWPTDDRQPQPESGVKMNNNKKTSKQIDLYRMGAPAPTVESSCQDTVDFLHRDTKSNKIGVSRTPKIPRNRQKYCPVQTRPPKPVSREEQQPTYRRPQQNATAGCAVRGVRCANKSVKYEDSTTRCR